MLSKQARANTYSAVGVRSVLGSGPRVSRSDEVPLRILGPNCCTLVAKNGPITSRARREEHVVSNMLPLDRSLYCGVLCRRGQANNLRSRNLGACHRPTMLQSSAIFGSGSPHCKQHLGAGVSGAATRPVASQPSAKGSARFAPSSERSCAGAPEHRRACCLCKLGTAAATC